MLKVEKLTKIFGSLVAVDEVSFEVPAGQMVGIIGRSGAGKSTLLRMINRLTDATSGRILCDDAFGAEVDVCALTGRRLREWRARCAMVFQQFNLVPRLAVMTNVLMRRRESMTMVALRRSSEAIGSSASRIPGSCTSARAMATRCCWPPESVSARWYAFSGMPTRSRLA